MQLLNEYHDWVNKRIPITSDWEEVINQIIYSRDLLHNELLNNQSLISDVRKIDTKWQNTILNTGNGSFKIDMNRQDKPKQQWWWLDNFNSLSEEDRQGV